MNHLKILLASDSFKGSASSQEVTAALEKGIRRVYPQAEIHRIGLADGGEGTTDVLVESLGGTKRFYMVQDPLGRPVPAKLGILPNGVVVMEMAEASGLQLLTLEERSPYHASTYGTGQLLRHALDLDPRRIYIGIGGSATNDGGGGMAQALGARLLDEKGEEIEPGVNGLQNLVTIDPSNLDKRLMDTQIIILSDVENLLCGLEGASYIYGPQKGATRADLPVFDGILCRYGRLLEETFQLDILQRPGSGAAGGLGAGLMAFTRAKSVSGTQTIMELTGLEEKIKEVDLVITGEGRMDAQSSYGKAPIGVAWLAKRHAKKVIAVVGSSGRDLSTIYERGVDLVLDIIDEPMELDDAMKNVTSLLIKAGESAIRAFLLGQPIQGSR